MIILSDCPDPGDRFTQFVMNDTIHDRMTNIITKIERPDEEAIDARNLCNSIDLDCE